MSNLLIICNNYTNCINIVNCISKNISSVKIYSICQDLNSGLKVLNTRNYRHLYNIFRHFIFPSYIFNKLNKT